MMGQEFCKIRSISGEKNKRIKVIGSVHLSIFFASHPLFSGTNVPSAVLILNCYRFLKLLSCYHSAAFEQKG